MRNMARTICLAVAAVGIAAGVALADNSPSASTTPPKGSIARQLLLKFKLQAGRSGLALADALRHSRNEWESLSPDQREQFREAAYAILQKSEKDQEQILLRYEKLIKMSAERQEAYQRRAKWLKAVLKTLSEEQKQQLLKLKPLQRARRLIEIRDQLVEQGKLALDEQDQADGSPDDPAAGTTSTNGDPNAAD